MNPVHLGTGQGCQGPCIHLFEVAGVSLCEHQELLYLHMVWKKECGKNMELGSASGQQMELYFVTRDLCDLRDLCCSLRG